MGWDWYGSGCFAMLLFGIITIPSYKKTYNNNKYSEHGCKAKFSKIVQTFNEQRYNSISVNEVIYLQSNQVPSSLLKPNSMVWVRERTIPTEQPSLVGGSNCQLFVDRGCHVVSVTDPYGRILFFYTEAATFLSSSSSVVLTRLSRPCSRPTTFFLVVPGIDSGPPDL
jgi:hypothetical protein